MKPAVETVCPNLVAGKSLFICPRPYDTFPQARYIYRQTDDLPMAVLICLKAQSRPCVGMLVQLIRQVYQKSRRKASPRNEFPAEAPK